MTPYHCNTLPIKNAQLPQKPASIPWNLASSLPTKGKAPASKKPKLPIAFHTPTCQYNFPIRGFQRFPCASMICNMDATRKRKPPNAAGKRLLRETRSVFVKSMTPGIDVMVAMEKTTAPISWMIPARKRRSYR